MARKGSGTVGKRPVAELGGGAAVAEVAGDAVADAVVDAASGVAGDARTDVVLDAVADAVSEAAAGPMLDGAEAGAIEVIGGRWKLLLIRALLVGGGLGYKDLLGSLAGIEPRELTRCLVELSAAGVVEQGAGASADAGGMVYSLTRAGVGLMPVFRSLGGWGRGFLDSDVRVVGEAGLGASGGGGASETRIPFGNDRKKSEGSGKGKAVLREATKGKGGGSSGTRIPSGNDGKKSSGNGKGKGTSRFPSGMTTKGATAGARAQADSLWE